MAQLSDDCFAFGGTLLPVEEASKRMAEHVPPVAEIERVSLTDALGRVVARDIVSGVALPPFDNSAVDGYAVRHADLRGDGDTALKVVGRLQAGGGTAPGVGPGEAVRIFTGAAMPQGADTVFMQEDVSAGGDGVTVPPGLKRGANSRFTGEDLKKGAVALPAGRRLTPRDIALGAAIGLTHLEVRRRPRVAVFSTGDEIIEPGQPLGPASLYDANRFLLLALLREAGAEPHDLGILRDDAPKLAAAIEKAAADHDLILTSGGVSTGEADYVKTAIEQVGKLVLWRLAIKPGRPVAMGVVRGTAFAGLPGNPVAVFVTFVHVVRPLLMRLAGADIAPPAAIPVRAAFSYKKKKGRREYVRVGLRVASDGIVEAVKHPQEGAGVITSLTETDGLAELLEDRVEVAPGSDVGFLSYASLVA
jgi:molybdopterin molybdotransferase